MYKIFLNINNKMYRLHVDGDNNIQHLLAHVLNVIEEFQTQSG